MANKISVIVDIATQSADAALKGFERSLKNVKQSVSEAEGAVGKLKAGASSAFAGLKANAGVAALGVGAALATLGKASVEAASNLTESINAVNVSYGESAEAVHKLGDESVESFGLSERAFNEAAVGFTSFAEDVAGDGGDVAATLDDLMTRSTDFASVMNMDVADATEAFKSALSGEAEPLKRFGINISDAATNAYALRTGMIKVGESLTDTQKVQARYGLLMEETNKVAGDFENTSGSLANQQKILGANLENLSATLGESLLPTLTAVIQTANLAVGAIEAVADAGGIRDMSLVPGVDVKKRRQETVDALKAEAGATEKVVIAGYEYINMADGLTKAYYEEIEAAEQHARFTEDATKAVRLETDAVNAAIDAHKKETDAINRVNEARRIGTDNIYAARSAERDWWTQVQNTTKALDDSTLGTLEKSAALDDLALSTADVTAKQLEAQGVDLGTVQGQKQWLQALKDTAAGLEGPMRDAILEYIALVEGIPAEKSTYIGVWGPGAGNAPRVSRGGGGGIPMGADGGIVTRPTLAIIGEAGPEAVVPLNRTPGSSPLRANDGASTVINLTVNGWVGNDQDLVRKLAEAFFAAQRNGVQMPWGSSR